MNLTQRRRVPGRAVSGAGVENVEEKKTRMFFGEASRTGN